MSILSISMKTAVVTLAVAFALTVRTSEAKASGCGGPELSIVETRVLKATRFQDTVKNFTVTLTTGAAGHLIGTAVDLYSELMVQPQAPSFYWHTLRPSVGSRAPDWSAKELTAALVNSNVELVEDKFDFNCGSPVSTDRQNNLRISVSYQGQAYELRTVYQPEATY